MSASIEQRALGALRGQAPNNQTKEGCSMDTDGELLELAAKAADEPYTMANFAEQGALPDGWGMVRDMESFWNPLTDDCAAMRLAVKLGLMIYIGATTVHVGKSYSVQIKLIESFYGEKEGCIATRRAIVRAAAEIGRMMP